MYVLMGPEREADPSSRYNIMVNNAKSCPKLCDASRREGKSLPLPFVQHEDRVFHNISLQRRAIHN
jgi:hypothetical protein